MARPTYRVVGRGVDTLRVNALGHLHEGVMEEFLGLQQEAVEERDARLHRRRDEVRLETPYTLDGQPLLIAPHGANGGMWQVLLFCPAARISLGAGQLNGISAQVVLSAAFLWQHGYRAAWDMVQALLDTWGGFIYQPSEVHLCADVAGKAAATLRDEDFVRLGHVARWRVEDAMILDIRPSTTAQEDRSTNELIVRYRQAETVSFSLTAPHSSVVYDKPREIRTHSPDKVWFGDIWEANGWDREQPVIRVEMRYEREVLHEMGIDTMDQLWEGLDSLWQYSTQKWLRHTRPTLDKNRSRWPTTAWWQMVQGVTFERADALPGVRVKQRQFHERKMLATILGYVESWVAWKAAEGGMGAGFDLYDALVGVFDHADDHYAYHETTFRQAVTQKRRKIGFTD
ncbi:MAG: hypothetical protein H0X24_25420 [Ktedonobacterales bacterium]|nr:hypothetical protein [Ktedonobacterales bacterium]